MSHFYGEIQGNRRVATRQGTKESGMQAHIRGWDFGVKIFLDHEDGEDVLTMTKTGGSNDPTSKEILVEMRVPSNG